MPTTCMGMCLCLFVTQPLRNLCYQDGRAACDVMCVAHKQAGRVTWFLLHIAGNGLIDAQQSAEGLIGVLESGRPLNGKWYDFAGKAIPW